MSRYDYQCSECGSIFEQQQPITEPPLIVAPCPTCQQMVPVTRRISTPHLTFKGNGWPGQEVKRGRLP